MITQVLDCPSCQGTDSVRYGTTSEGKQRYRCRACCQGRGRVHICQVIAAETRSRKAEGRSNPPRPLGRPLRARNLSPTLASMPHLFTVLRRGQQMPPGAEVLGKAVLEPKGVY
jgi:hypothetical protein